MEHAAALRDLKLLVGIGSLDVHHVEQISFRQCVTFCEHGQLKGWQQHFQPTEAKSSISTLLHCFVVFVTWKHGADIEKCHNKSLWRPQTKNIIETSLWVAWIERALQTLGTENSWRKIIRIHHWFTIQTPTLTMFELDSDSQFNNSPLRTLWCLYELNVFAIALLLNKPCISHSQTHCAHSFGSFVLYTAPFPDIKFWTFLGVEGTQLHVMSSWLLSNCLRTLLRNVSHQEQVNLSSGLIHQTVQAGLCQHKVHCPFANHVPDTTASLQAGHQHNLVQRHGFNLKCVKANLAARRHGWWEGTVNYESPFVRVVAVSCGNGTGWSKNQNLWTLTVRYFPILEEKI